VHRAIADCLRRGLATSVEPLSLRDQVLAATLAADPFRRDCRRGFLLLRSMVTSYLRDWRLDGDWSLLGAECLTADGHRTDLLFRNDAAMVVADELKSTSAAPGSLSQEQARQLLAYLRALRSEFGASLQGVRLVHLGTPSHARLYTNASDVLAEEVR
jgi:hypothetical protein